MDHNANSFTLLAVSTTFLMIEKLLILTPELQLLALFITILSGVVALLVNIPRLATIVKLWFK
jgi:hypothetical protein